MPTIQLKITDEQFQHLQELTGEKTGSKAIFSAITELEELRDAFTALHQDYMSVSESLNAHQYYLDHLKEFFSWFNSNSFNGFAFNNVSYYFKPESEK